jgi:anaerobic selenocysteine-containing dehydrogenase
LDKFEIKGVEQHLVPTAQRAYFYSLVFSTILLIMTGTLKKKGAGCIYNGRLHHQRHVRTHQLELHDDLLALVSSAIPCFDGNFDHHAYMEWELKIEKEFDEHDISETQIIYIASHALTEYVLLE